jgi:pyruvate,water dikinase
LSTSIIKPLAHIRATDVAFSGGKGANLGELLAAGLPVPDAFVVGVPAYQAAVTKAPAVMPAPEPTAVRDAILADYRAMGDDVAVAVRSSAVDEDGASASHAGIYATVLNVRGATEVLDAVRCCWASASSSAARRYGDALHREPADARIAVVVQRQITCARAGVAFTADPVTGRPDRLVIESAAGAGENVVGGLVTPDRIVVDKHSLRVVAIDRGSQQTKLSHKQIRVITRHVLRIEQHYGSPQDIEWAFDEHGWAWILQARPITTLDAPAARAKAVEFYDPPRPAGSRWSRANIAEALPGVPTPLTWSLWRAGLNNGHRRSQIRLGVVSKRDDARVPLVTVAQGWPVLSIDRLVSQIAHVPGMNVRAFSEQLLGAAEHVQPPPARARAATAARMATRAPLNVALLQRRLRAASAASRHAWQRDAWRPAADPLALLSQAATRFQDTMTVHAMQTNVCQCLYQAVERVAGGLAIDLVSGDGALPEAQLATDLWLLARGRISVQRFLSEHGFHGPDEGELASPSWRQHPEPVLRAARAWAEHSRDPDAALARRREKRCHAEAALRASLPRSRRPVVARLIAMARTAVIGREIGKAAFLQDLDVARHAMSFLGDDAAWRTLDEHQKNTKLSTADLAARQRIRSQLAAQEPPLSFVENPENQPPDSGDDARLSVTTGVGASPGVARGRARVVMNATAVVALDGGDVLIARTTDPSWVPAFMTVAGMVIDVGGTLSHAAIIARELGIPCVIGTGSGTQVIPEGALVEIDGSQGTVRILDTPRSDPRT